MIPSKIFIDANLLILLVVGETRKELIAKHRRLRQFQVEDYERLAQLVNEIDYVLVTPNTLTEASNLMAQHGEPERSRFFGVLRALIEESEEVVVASEVASRNSEFDRLGLTDAALLEAVPSSTPVVTADFDLYWAASNRDPNSAFNFWHAKAW